MSHQQPLLFRSLYQIIDEHKQTIKDITSKLKIESLKQDIADLRAEIDGESLELDERHEEVTATSQRSATAKTKVLVDKAEGIVAGEHLHEIDEFITEKLKLQLQYEFQKAGIRKLDREIRLARPENQALEHYAAARSAATRLGVVEKGECMVISLPHPVQ